jgi:hypothetical protein
MSLSITSTFGRKWHMSRYGSTPLCHRELSGTLRTIDSRWSDVQVPDRDELCVICLRAISR